MTFVHSDNVLNESSKRYENLIVTFGTHENKIQLGTLYQNLIKLKHCPDVAQFDKINSTKYST